VRQTCRDDVDLPDDWEDGDSPDTGRRRGRRLALFGLGLVAVVVIGAGVVIGSYMKSLSDSYQKREVVSITRGPSDGERPEHVDGTGRNFLLLGSDKRSEEEADSTGASGEHSDVMMLHHVSDDEQNERL